MAALESDQAALLMEMKKGYEFRSKISDITHSLKIYEKISLIFLLCKDPGKGLKMMDLILKTQGPNGNSLFYKWLKDELSINDIDWKEILAESLTIIQNYRLAKILGFEKHSLTEKFSQDNIFKSCHILPIRKILYNLCESLTLDECKSLICTVEGDQSQWILYLEYKLLYWSKQDVICLRSDKPVTLDNLIQCMQKLGWCDFIDDMKIVIERTNCSFLRRKYNLNTELDASEYYQIIDKKNLGLCVIINEKNFSIDMLPKRWGTDKDVDRLTEVFTAFGFNIRLHADLSYKQLINVLNYYAKIVSENSSVFILIILSHGSENVIYTSDAVPVDIGAIEMIFQAEFCPNLSGKPKIFIVQSCQGEKWQKLVRGTLEPHVETDNFASSTSPSITVAPQRGDSLIAWSTVQGFASFRDKYNGSWYVKELCDELWKFGDTFDLVEIFTRVNNNLRSKVYQNQFMVPSLLSSLRAKVRFPHFKQNFTKGQKLMIERLIFDKYFKEFLIEYGPFMLKFE